MQRTSSGFEKLFINSVSPMADLAWFASGQFESIITDLIVRDQKSAIQGAGSYWPKDEFPKLG